MEECLIPDDAAERDGIPSATVTFLDGEQATTELKDEDFSKKQASPVKKKRAGPKLVINTFNTQYPVITDVGKAVGFRCK